LNSSAQLTNTKKRSAFSLLEMTIVIAILTLLATIGISITNTTNAQELKTNTDILAGLIEQARVAATTSRSHIILGIDEPETSSTNNGQCRVALFKLDEWPEQMASPLELKGKLLNRWQNLSTGIVLLEDEVEGIPNLMDAEKITVNYGGAKNLTTQIHAIAIHPRGGLQYPLGSSPLLVRLAVGGYRDGKATPNKHGDLKQIWENRLKIGRVNARAYPIN
jgi:prepilin-type N-terminal cleavage/methylation domain-containing protein